MKGISHLILIPAIFISLSSSAWSFFPNSNHKHHLLNSNNRGGDLLLQQQRQYGKWNPQVNTKLDFNRDQDQNQNQSSVQMNAIPLSDSSRGGGDSSNSVSPLDKISSIIQKNSFLLGMACAVSFARAFPSLGVNGGILKPELFIGKFGVTCIFLLSGVSLELSELKEAITNVKLNSIVQLGSFLAWPFLVGIPLVEAIKKFAPNLLPKPLLDGLIILTCLPTTVNMAVLLTGRAGGNVASALANAVFGNLLGIFATPALLMHFFGTMIDLPFLQMVWKLCNKVLFPVGTYKNGN